MALGTDWLDSSFGNISSSHGQFFIKEVVPTRKPIVENMLYSLP
jgi:hypothetical protein